ncbi:hypothetical protein ACIQFU_08815 [Streptomyces sp. NPDC093065]|uniref:hypothetical protein n=1 Tax=Streptomyces sp. NPDC093065 TaxID=3366021 RepID=UPI00382EAFCD
MSTARDHGDVYADPAGAGVFLAAEAALLEARLGMLSDALRDVDTRIGMITASLHKLRHSVPEADGGEQ